MLKIARERTRSLASFERATAAFEQLFGVDPHAVLAAMDAAADDVPAQQPAVAIPIDRVSMRRRDVIVDVMDPLGSGLPVSAVCTLDLSASLPAAHRGVHVSRMSDVIARSVEEEYPDITAFADALARAVAEVQYGTATVDVDARFPYLETVQTPGRPRKSSLETLAMSVHLACAAQASVADVTLIVPHMIACPCVQQTYKHMRRLQGLSGDSTGLIPLPTHSQRCETRVTIEGLRATYSAASMMRALDAVLVRTCNTLPRDHELAYVYRAHREPQFIEDVVRIVAVAAAAERRREDFGAVRVRSRSLESIHDFDLSAELVVTSGELQRLGLLSFDAALTE